MPIIGLIVVLVLIGLTIKFWFVTIPLMGVGLACTVRHYWQRDLEDFALPDEEREALFEARKQSAAARQKQWAAGAPDEEVTRARLIPTRAWLALLPLEPFVVGLVVAGLMIVVPPVLALTVGTGWGRATSTADAPKGDPGLSNELREAELGSAWPLNAPSARIYCDPFDFNGRHGGAVYAEIDGARYAINGLALTRADYPPLPRSLWRDNPDYPGLDLKIDISPIIDRGLALCEEQR